MLNKTEKSTKKHAELKVGELIDIINDKDKVIQALEATVKRKDEIIDRFTALGRVLPEKEE